MIGLVMCGGKGTRMETVEEKLLLRYKKPIIQHVIAALQESECFSRVVCATSPNAPKTHQFVNQLGISIIETKGRGYVEDLSEALGKLDDQVFVVSGDLPFLDAEIVQEIVQRAKNGGSWLSVIVTNKFLDQLGVKLEYNVNYGYNQCAYTGISVVNPNEISEMKKVDESYIILDDKRVAINLNTKKDYDLICST